MARGFKTAPTDFVEDFIFQPDFNLAAQIIQQKDAEVKNQIEQISILGTPNFDFARDADGENAQRIKSSYESKADEIAKILQENTANPLKSRMMIQQLRRDFENDTSTGEIRKLSDNVKAYNDFQTRLNALQNPADREAYSTAWNQYVLNTPKGALGQIFQGPDMFDTRNLPSEFISSDAFKQLKTETNADTIDQVGGQWIVTKGNRQEVLSPERIQQAFKTFIDGEGLGGYASSRRRYFGELDWLDENGKLNWNEGSRLDKMSKGLSSYSYENKETVTKNKANEYGLAKQASDLKKSEIALSASLAEQASIRAEKRAAAKASSSARAEQGLAYPTVGAEVFKFTPEGKKVTQEFMENERNIILGGLPPNSQAEYKRLLGTDFKKAQAFLNSNKAVIFDNESRSPLASQLAAQLRANQDRLDNSFRAGFEIYDKLGYSDKQIKGVMEHYAKDETANRIAKQPGFFDFGYHDQTGTGKAYETLGDKKNKSTRPTDAIGAKYNAPGATKGWEIVDIKPVKGSAKPWAPMTQKNNYSGAVLDYEVILAPPKDKNGNRDEDKTVTIPATWNVTEFEDFSKAR